MPFNYVQESVRQTHHERNLLIYKRPFALDDMDTGGRAPTVGDRRSSCREFIEVQGFSRFSTVHYARTGDIKTMTA